MEETKANTTTPLKVKDWVRITAPGEDYDGKVGRVVSVRRANVEPTHAVLFIVLLPTGAAYAFADVELELADAPAKEAWPAPGLIVPPGRIQPARPRR